MVEGKRFLGMVPTNFEDFVYINELYHSIRCCICINQTNRFVKTNIPALTCKFHERTLKKVFYKTE